MVYSLGVGAWDAGVAGRKDCTGTGPPHSWDNRSSLHRDRLMDTRSWCIRQVGELEDPGRSLRIRIGSAFGPIVGMMTVQIQLGLGAGGSNRRELISGETLWDSAPIIFAMQAQNSFLHSSLQMVPAPASVPAPQVSRVSAFSGICRSLRGLSVGVGFPK